MEHQTASFVVNIEKAYVHMNWGTSGLVDKIVIMAPPERYLVNEEPRTGQV
jgi:hypothetical protein